MSPLEPANPSHARVVDCQGPAFEKGGCLRKGALVEVPPLLGSGWVTNLLAYGVHRVRAVDNKEQTPSGSLGAAGR